LQNNHFYCIQTRLLSIKVIFLHKNALFLQNDHFYCIQTRLLKYEDIKFLNICKREKLIPRFINKSFNLKNPTKKVSKLVENAKKKWMSNEVKFHYANIERMKLELYNKQLLLLKYTSPLQWRQEEERISRQIGVKCKEKRQRLKGKLKILREKAKAPKWTSPTPPPARSFIINKSSETFTDEQLNLLNKGLKYKPKPSSH
jgi:hypothetical protein